MARGACWEGNEQATGVGSAIGGRQMEFSSSVVPMADAGTLYLARQTSHDRSLADQVKRVLDSTGYRALGATQVVVQRRVVILKGDVPSYYLKQVAQAVAMKVTGVRELRNDVQVMPC